jgi:hypothetical protein
MAPGRRGGRLGGMTRDTPFRTLVAGGGPAALEAVDAHGRVRGMDVWAAGDGTDREPKQGGLAAQQAEVAARSIAAAAGAPVDTPPYAPVLRALLATGAGARYVERGAEPDAPTVVSRTPLWEPPTKIAGRRLGPFLDALDASTPRSNRFERRLALATGRPGR